jgi:hypothetical protein
MTDAVMIETGQDRSISKIISILIAGCDAEEITV